ncbi:MAG: prepilin-type N-terminal cleavage/methylation domain-containing protein [Raoultibacter sp.]
MNNSRKQSGFTLAELLIVVAIILVLVAIAIPVFTGSAKRAEEAACASNRTSLSHMLTTQCMLGTPFNEEAARTLAADQKLVCPTGGTFSIIKDQQTARVRVTCSKHKSTSTISEETKTDFETFWEDYKKTGSSTEQSNSNVRKAFFAYWAQQKKTLPKLKVNNIEYIIQPFCNPGKESDNNLWLFAKKGTGDGWNVPYVYDPIDKKWYGATNYYGILDDINPKSATFGTGGSAEDLHAELTASTKGGPNNTQVRKWLPLEHYEEIPSHDITNP